MPQQRHDDGDNDARDGACGLIPETSRRTSISIATASALGRGRPCTGSSLTRRYDCSSCRCAISIIVGAGPSGLATAIAAGQAGLDYTVLEKGVLVNSIYQFPVHMSFFTTPELLEIGGVPLVTPYEKPTRIEALRYYRRVPRSSTCGSSSAARSPGFDRDAGDRRAHRDEPVVAWHDDGPRARRGVGHRLLRPSQPAGRARRGPAARLALLPRRPLLLPAARGDRRRQELGGRGGAGIVPRRRARDAGPPAIDARGVDQVLGEARHRQPDRRRLHPGALRHACRGDHAGGGRSWSIRATRETLPADRVFLLTGYHADFALLEACGIGIDAETGVPAYDPSTLESNVPNVFLAGGVLAGRTRRRSSSRTGGFMASAWSKCSRSGSGRV